MRIRAVRDDRGATAVEYALIMGLIAVVIVASVGLLGGSISGLFQSSGDSIGDAVAAGTVGDTPLGDTPPGDTPPGDTPPADTPPADTPPADTPPADTPPADTPPADTPPGGGARCTPEGYDADGSGNTYKSPTCSKESGDWAWKCGGKNSVLIDGRITCLK